MHNELVIEKFGYNKNESENNSINILKKIGNDSLFYFAIFLSAFALLQYVPFVSGLFENFTIGINEVAVSLVGFANVFFLQVYNKIFKK